MYGLVTSKSFRFRSKKIPNLKIGDFEYYIEKEFYSIPCIFFIIHLRIAIKTTPAIIGTNVKIKKKKAKPLSSAILSMKLPINPARKFATAVAVNQIPNINETNTK